MTAHGPSLIKVPSISRAREQLHHATHPITSTAAVKPGVKVKAERIDYPGTMTGS